MVIASALFTYSLSLLCIGDSLTVGLGLEFYEQEAKRFCSVTADDLRLTVINRGCGGSTTQDWQPNANTGFCGLGAAWQTLAQEDIDSSDVIHILLGLNDSVGFFENCSNQSALSCPIRPNEYRGNLEAIIEGLPPQTLILISSPPNPPVWRDNTDVHLRLLAYREAIITLVLNYNNVCLGVDTWTLLPDDSFLPNNIHFNEEGHFLLGKALADRLKDLFSLPNRKMSLQQLKRDKKWRKLCHESFSP